MLIGMFKNQRAYRQAFDVHLFLYFFFEIVSTKTNSIIKIERFFKFGKNDAGLLMITSLNLLNSTPLINLSNTILYPLVH